MLARFRRFFAPPIFDDEEKTRVSRFMTFFSWAAIAILLLIVLFRIAFLTTRVTTHTVVFTVVIALLFLMQYLVKQGHVYGASAIVTLGIWGMMTYLAWYYDGLRDLSVTAYIIVVLFASLLLGWRFAMVMGLLSISSIWYFGLAEHLGMRPFRIDNPINYAFDLTSIFVLVSTLIYLLVTGWTRTLRSAHLELQERLRAEQKLQQQADYLTALHETALGLVNRLELNPLLESILMRASELLDTPHVALNLVLPDESALKQELGHGIFVEFDGVTTQRDFGVVGKAWERAEIFMVQNYGEWEGRLPEAIGKGFETVVGAPFKLGDKVIGVLLVAHIEKNRTFTDQQIILLERFATLAALAIQNTRLHEQAQTELSERRIVESALRASEETFRKVFYASPVAACITSLEEGRLLEANDAYWKISGFDSSASIGHTWQELDLWDSEDQHREFVERLKHEHSIHEPEYTFSTPQNEQRAALAFYELVEIKGQTCVLSMFYDVTPQRQAQEELQASEERFRKVFHTSQMAICIASLREGRFIEANNAFWQLTGLQPETSLGHTAIELGMWKHVGERKKFVQDMLEKHSLRNVEVDFPDHGTGVRNVVAFYELIQLKNEECVLAMFYDITEQKQVQKALREAEARTRALLDAVPDMIFEISKDGTFKGYIPSSEIRPLLPPEQFLGRTIRELFPSQIAEQTMFALERALETRQLHAFEYGMPPGEETQFFEARVSAISSDLALVMVRDISQRKWIETEREKLIKELEDKNAELERFTYTVSHDLKSPLITIKGFLGFIEQDAAKGNLSRLKADTKRIADAADKMQSLLNELLELSRVGRLMNPYEQISFTELAEEAVELVQGRLLNANARVHVQKKMPFIHGDRRRLLEVLQNLVDNAAKFVGNQSKPKIEIGQKGEEDGKPIFFVRDNGIGIAMEHQDRIFGLFNKLDTDSEGTGIGLTLVKRIIEVHQGRIWVQSETGKGSTFFFTLQTEPQA